MRCKRILFVIFICSCAFSSGHSSQQPFEQFKEGFITGYTALNLPEINYDYRDYFSNIPSPGHIQKQKVFFKSIQQALPGIEKGKLNQKQKNELNTIAYEAQLNLKRLSLEEAWVADGREIPLGGLFTLPNHKAWCQYFIQKFTSTDITPQQVFEMGKSEVARVKKEIKKLQDKLGYTDEAAFYSCLNDASFFITDKSNIIKRFKAIDSVVRRNLHVFVAETNIPSIYPMEWPNAGPATPPGIYINHSGNAYGKDVFQFNFYGGRYNHRVMDWIYMHEAIPGHHLQASVRTSNPLLELFVYPGNFEGWSCYVEYYGKEIGLYADAFSELGKWEWDLVRSLRLVLDAGIHFYGWSKEDALKYWKENIMGQDDIAEREVDRVTNWAAQALSYKVGAAFIFGLQEAWQQKNPGKTLKNFRGQYLSYGMLPLLVMKDAI